MVKGKSDAASVRVPQSREEAAAMIAEFGDVSREVEIIETAMQEKLAGVKIAAEKEAAPHVAKAKELLEGIKIYCTANRQSLLANTGLKSHDFGTGKVSWRFKTARVTFEDEAEVIINRITERYTKAVERGENGNDYKNFLRVTVEIDKDAMRKDAALARSIEGVKVGRDGETFEVEPFSAQLAEAV